MEELARARIVMWQGGSLWLMNAAARTGDLAPRTGAHAHHAIQIVLGLGGRFRLWLADQTLPGPYVAVAPDARHAFDADGAYAILFIEPESPAGRAVMAAFFPAGPLHPLSEPLAGRLERQLSALAGTPAPTTTELASLGQAMVDQLAGAARPDQIDPRVAKVLARVAGDQDIALNLAGAARIAGLSPSRMSHLFVEQTGLAFKTYLLWIRLTRAVGLMARGDNLTDVAHSAGFSDSAHFSRTFRRMFGIAPASLRLF